MSNLEDLYREIILDHYRNPRNRGELVTPPAHKAEGFNPLCGDEITVYLQVEGDTLVDIKIAGHGCSISQSSASLMTAAVKGKPLEAVRGTIDTFKQLMTVHESSLDTEVEPEPVNLRALGELAALQGVVKFPVRIKCATLAWNTLTQGLNDLA
ncbi:MAG: SUF system NifU family Fe-S cluster assembly protein [Actinomycetes bacterium]